MMDDLGWCDQALRTLKKSSARMRGSANRPRKQTRRRRRILNAALESLESRRLLTGVTLWDTFSSDVLGATPSIQPSDVGQTWTTLGSPQVGTGSTATGTLAPLDVDISGASQWVRLDGSGQAAQGRFSEVSSLNGTTVGFDFFGVPDAGSDFASNEISIQGEAGDLLRLQFTTNDNSAATEISVPFEIIVNGQSTGVSGPAGNAWYAVEITLNESDWDLTWQAYGSSGGQTTTLIGSQFSIDGFSYLTGAGGGAAAVTFSDDGDRDGDGDGVMFFSNVITTDANDAPVAFNDFVTTDIDVSVTFDVLANDVDDDGLTVDSFFLPSNGTLTDNGSGSFTYLPNTGFVGADQFDYTIDDGSGQLSTATAYVYTSDVLGLPAYATRPNAPAVIYLDFDGAEGDDPFNRAGDITSFNSFEQDLIRQSVEYTAQAFAMFDVNVTTVLTPDLPKAWTRIRSNGSGGAAFVGSFPNPRSRGYVGSGDRMITTGLAHEIGHILNVTHQSTFGLDGSQTAEYRSNLDGEGATMGVDFSGNVIKWWWGPYRGQPTQLQDDVFKIRTEIAGASASSNGLSADDHASSIAHATPMQRDGAVWSSTGLINDLNDVDTFVFDWSGGDVDVSGFRIDPYTQSNRGDPSSVDLVISVFDLEGRLLGYSNPDSYRSNAGLNADVTIPDLAAGSYIVSASSHGDYADIGVYSLNVEPGVWSGTNTSTNALSAPTDLAVTWVASTSAHLSWSDVDDETGYRIERSTNNVDFTPIGNTGAGITTYRDAGGLDPSTHYYYRVRAEDASTVSAASNVALAVTRPGEVTNLTVSEFIGTTKVISWKVQRTSGETGFRVERSTDGVTFTTIANLPANRPSYSDTGLDIHETYFYRVVTRDSLGDAAITTASTTYDSLIARYDFDDLSARDSSLFGNDNGGTFRNGASVTFDPTRNSHVLALDGANDYVAIADSTDINLGTHTTRTISASFNADSTSGRQVIYEEGGTTTGYNLYIDSGLLYAGVWGMNGGVANAFLSTAIVANQWYNVSLVNDSITGFVTGYLDGVAFGTTASGSTQQHTDDIAIGGVAGTTKVHTGNITPAGAYFEGKIDDLRIYNTVEVGNSIPVASNDTVVMDNDEVAIISVLGNDSDADGDGLVIMAVTQGNSGTVAMTEFGAITYTPNADYFGNDTFTYDVSDNHGGTSTATVNVRVDSTGLIARYTFDDGTAADTSTQGRGNSGSLINGATVVDDPVRGNVLSVDGINDHVSVANSADINNLTVSDRTIFLSFNADSTSGRQVIYEEGGTTRGIAVYIDSGILYVGAWGMNGIADAYVSRVVTAGQWNHVHAVLDSKTGKFSASLNGYVIGTGDVGPMDAHTGGIGIGGVRGSMRFHNGNFDGNGLYFGGLVDNVRIHNSAVDNALPSPAADDVSTDEDTAVVITPLGNDIDQDGDILWIDEVTQGAHGIVSVIGDEITYLPDEDFFGSDSFTYSVADGFGGTAVATISVEVDPVNDAPTAIAVSNTSISENTDTTGGLSVGELLTTDIDSASFTYDLVSGMGDVDNGQFEIVGGELMLKSGVDLDFETQDQYSVRVEVSDGSEVFEQTLVINVDNRLELEGQVIVGDGANSRSMVSELEVRFDEIVSIQTDAFALVNQDNLQAVTVAWSVDDTSGKSVVTLTFSGTEVDPVNGSLRDGNYLLTIDGTMIVSVATGEMLDGDGSGIAGTSYVFGDDQADAFFRLFGDSDVDRDVDLLDFAEFRRSFGATTGSPDFEAPFDHDQDGLISLTDFAQFRAAFGSSV